MLQCMNSKQEAERKCRTRHGWLRASPFCVCGGEGPALGFPYIAISIHRPWFMQYCNMNIGNVVWLKLCVNFFPWFDVESIRFQLTSLNIRSCVRELILFYQWFDYKVLRKMFFYKYILLFFILYSTHNVGWPAGQVPFEQQRPWWRLFVEQIKGKGLPDRCNICLLFGYVFQVMWN